MMALMNSIAGSLTAHFRVHGPVALALLVVFSFVCCVTADTVRLTMVTPTPYGAGQGASITCFRSSPDTNITLSFGRPFQIGLPGSSIQTSTSLPTGSAPSTNGEAVTQHLTTSVDATGLFHCEGTNRGLTTRVYSIIHSVYRQFEPADGLVTKTINQGEGVTLSVTPYGGQVTAPIWRQISSGGVDDINDWTGQNTRMLQVTSSEARDGDLYAVIQSTLEVNDNHFSIIRLIVRGCAANKWGPPACVGVCDMCYNGGVCDDETGNCICPPGFSGQNCLNACGMHRFGWDCEFQCGTSLVSCTGSQFGLPDPYGNSCISGYTGRDCNFFCPAGMFGAACTQSCRCMSGMCDGFTGECTGTPSGCLAGWSGTSCQIEGTCPVGYFGLDCLSECHCSNDAACVRDSGYCSGSNGACASGFTSDIDSMNCQTGITVFQMLARTNPGQAVIFNCAATAGDDLSADSLVLFAGGPYLTYIQTRTEGKMLINTFSVSSLQQDNVISCLLFRNTVTVTSKMLSVSFFALPYLSQKPSVTAESASAAVNWEAWGPNPMDTGDGPVVAYRVYYSPATSPLNWTVAGEIPETDPPQPMYCFKVEPLQLRSNYTFSVAAVREGPGGEGPRSPKSDSIQILPPQSTRSPTTAEPLTTVPTPPEITNPPISDASLTTEDTTTMPQGTVTAGTPGIQPLVIVVPVVIVVLLIIMVVLLFILVKRLRKKRRLGRASENGLVGKFESNHDLASLHTIDNPVRISMEDLNSNGGIVPATTSERPVSGTSQISTLDSSSPFAGLPLLPTGERELKRQPVPLKDFVEYVHAGIQNGRFRDEWENLPGLAAMCSCDVSQQGDNKMRNRYRNVPAYDHCRVKLDSGGGDLASDYINASYIKGYMNDKAYIATQGPNQATAPDFWRMVWQENVHTIIICTNLVEDGKSKCVKYWPDQGQVETMGDITVNLKGEELKGEYIVRTMSIAKVKEEGSVPRKVTQFHYTTWPDKGVPKDATPVLKFIQDFSDATPKDSGPFLVHCSAGVGRTGAVIALHGSLKRAHAEKTVDVYNFVADMRDHRISIVQTPEQYTFVHIALLEALFAGDTCIPASALKKRLTELKKKKKLAEEFEQLRNISPLPNQAKCRNSLAPDNDIRNRFPDTLIPEVCRPYLMTPREDGVEYNYINATFVNGFKQTDVAIMTQAPLPNTVLDLWRLVYDYAVSSIVMLNTLDPEDPKCPQYWPDKGSEDYGPFDITVSNSVEKDGFNVRLLQMVHRRQTREHFLTHYQFTDWPMDQETPASPDAILRLILEVEKDKGNQKRSLILVHCINGLDRSGVFCTLKNSLDRLRQEDVVDIMQTVKVLRFNRPNMLTSLNQYRFCYETMQAYIDNREKFESSKSEERLYENLPSKNETPQETIYQNVEPTPQSSDA